MATQHTNYQTAALKIIERVGKKVVIGAPLGLGKPIGLLNALYQLASSDPSINLTIITALTLARPPLDNLLQKRFVGPFLERLIKDYEDPLYEAARMSQQLPKNIKVMEFFFATGKYLHNSSVQQNYISSKYTSVVTDVLNRSVNVVATQVAHSSENPDHYSLSSNTDLFVDIVRRLKEKMGDSNKFAFVAEVNNNLPYMYNDAVMHTDIFTDVVDTGRYRALFALPRDEISPQDHMIGIYASCLIKDDSCLQVGIGALGNTVANAIIMRHKNNEAYRDLLKHLAVQEKFGETISSLGTQTTFDKGIYASTEMFSDEYIALYKEGILKKQVYDHIGLQRLLNGQKISEKIAPEMIEALLAEKIIHAQLTADDLQFLITFGIFKSGVAIRDDQLTLPSGETISADLTRHGVKEKIVSECLGDKLKNGRIVHAGFFLGSVEFYEFLRSMPKEESLRFDMTTVSRTNTVIWSKELSELQRQHARYINSAMMITLSGALVSDGLANLQEISGVGGQFDFVNMAQELPETRSLICCRSTRLTSKGTQSNVVWDYPNMTIPRYLRDIVITEYGIADCRSKTDAEVITSILNITDSRYQNSLLATAKKYGKIPQDHQIPAMFRDNYPEKIITLARDMRKKGFFKPYPFGCDFTEDELVLKDCLTKLKNTSPAKLMMQVIASMFFFQSDDRYFNYLQRMGLEKPSSFQEFVYKKLLKYVISRRSP